MAIKAYGAYASDRSLEPLEITRRSPTAHDVQIEIANCGVCHSDLHQYEPGGLGKVSLHAPPRNRRSCIGHWPACLRA
jgi:D-arabinose 1-dehydrogenase-like Zn-dependent alcohol dehydrogenase